MNRWPGLHYAGHKKKPVGSILTIKAAGRYIFASPLGGRSTVGQQTLDLLIGVRIPASQPLKSSV